MPIANIPLVRLGAASGTQRTVIDTDTARSLREANLLVEESHRVRPRWFDGKFLAARDLTHEQAYFLARQAGFARGLGAGVVEGLDVSAGSVGTELRVAAGFGTTSAGELVALTGEVRVSLAQLFTLQTLAQQLGTVQRPAPPLRNRTGVFVLGLRALEFAANPVAAYPTGLDAQRVVEAGDIVEASALTLHHLRDAPADRIGALRGDLAREVFVQQAGPALPAEVLPIAVLALAGDQVLWIDTHLVRRSAGQAHADVLGFGFAPRLLREAHLAQYRAQLADVMARPLGARPSAAAWFAALPPAGPMPAAAIDARDFSQSWLPPGVTADLTLVPEDEIPVLVEESLTLPPIDLALTAAGQASTSVAILVPVPRQALAARLQALQPRAGGAPVRSLVAPATTLVARRTPADTLKLLQTARLVRSGAVPVPVADPADAAWAALLSTCDVLWYARRRSVAPRPELEGVAVALRSDGPTPDAIVNARFDALGVADRIGGLLARSDSLARAEVVKLLAAEKFASPLLAQAALAQLEARKTLDETAVAEVAATLNAPGVADGLATLEAARPDLVADPETVVKLAASDQLLAVGRTLSRATGFEARQLAGEIRLARGKLNLDRVLAMRAGTVKPN